MELNSHFLVLTVDRNAARTVREAQKEHYEATGDWSVYCLPVAVMLCPSEKERFDRKTWHEEVTFSSNSIRKTQYGYVLTPSSALDFLPFSTPECGIFFSKEMPVIRKPFTIRCRTFRLAMLHFRPDSSCRLLQ